MRVYFDVCCLCRLFDDLGIERNRIEADAVLAILSLLSSGHLFWVTSSVVAAEMSAMTDAERRKRAFLLLDLADEMADPEMTDANDHARATELESMGFRSLDALHLEAAEFAKCNVFVTTDDKLLKVARRCSPGLPLAVCDPLTFLAEYFP